MAMIVRITGGVNASVETLFMIFKSKESSYPTRGCPDDVPGACYRTGPKCFIDGRLFPEYFNEIRAHYRSPGDRRPRMIFLDNSSGLNPSEELNAALRALNITLDYFPANATDLIQPADSFIISKIKQHWTD